ncbi:MAG: hypothetical protein AB7P21_19265 [Lautropia sp.]
MLPVLLAILALYLVRRVWSGFRWSHGDFHGGLADRSWHRRVGVDPWPRFVPTIEGEPLRSAVPPRSRSQARHADFACSAADPTPPRKSWSADFVREFALNGKVLVDAMSAAYADGVLTTWLPKTPEAMQPKHTVVIA